MALDILQRPGLFQHLVVPGTLSAANRQAKAADCAQQVIILQADKNIERRVEIDCALEVGVEDTAVSHTAYQSVKSHNLVPEEPGPW